MTSQTFPLATGKVAASKPELCPPSPRVVLRASACFAAPPALRRHARMWGDTRAAPAARRDLGPSAAASTDIDIEPNPASVADAAAAVAAAQASDDEEQASFRRRSARFDDAERSFNALMHTLDEHKAALAKVADSGVAVAERLNEFFSQKDAHRGLATSFLAAQRQARGQWLGFERRYEREVVKPIRSRVDEIPKVREGIKRRAAALTEMKRLQRKTASDGKGDGIWGKVKQRRLKELKDVSVQYAMHHSEVMRKFSNIERNFGNFVSPSLKALVALLSEASSSSVASLDDVEKLVAAVTPMTRELSPVPMGPAQGAPAGEKWDDFFDDTVMLSPSSSSPPPLPQGAHSLVEGGGGNPRPSRSELTISAPASVAIPTPDRRAIASMDTASLPDLSASSPRNVQFGPVHANVNGAGFSGAFTAPGATASGSSSSGERVAAGDYDGGGDRGSSSIGNGNGSTTDLTARMRQHVATDGRRRAGADKGSSDTVPSDTGLGVRPEVLMRVLVRYDFSPREVNEIELRKGDVVEVSEKTDSGWWYGRCRRSTGFFPQNYTRELSEQEELDFIGERQRRRRERRQGHRRRDSRDSRRSGRSASVASHAPLQP